MTEKEPEPVEASSGGKSIKPSTYNRKKEVVKNKLFDKSIQIYEKIKAIL